jgi:undecaprenyl-diphosphatase
MRRNIRVPGVLIALFLAAGTLWVFEEIQEKFVSGRARAIDTAILLAFRTTDPTDPVGPKWVEELARDITALGSLSVLALVIAASVLFLFITRQRVGAWMVLAATVGGIAATFIFKAVFARPRPDLLLHDAYVTSSSFPSGHAVMSVAVAVTLLVGLSRIYLGVHWPSDVLGGWSLGAAWAIVCWATAEWFENRRGANEGTSVRAKTEARYRRPR